MEQVRLFAVTYIRLVGQLLILPIEYPSEIESREGKVLARALLASFIHAKNGVVWQHRYVRVHRGSK